MVQYSPSVKYFQSYLMTSYKHLGFEKFPELYTHLAQSDKEALIFTNNINKRYKLIFNYGDNTFEWQMLK